MEFLGLGIAKTILRKENKAGSLTLYDFKTYYKDTAIKTGWYWHKHRYTDQWNRIENPEINSCLYGQMIFNMGAKNNNGETTVPNKWSWENWISTCKGKKLERILHHIEKLTQNGLKT